MSVSSLWEGVWNGQGRRCYRCKREIALAETHKNSYSFALVCRRCLRTPNTIVFIDEIGTTPTPERTGEKA